MTNEYYGAPTTANDDFLAHYGVKGMKWGVRKAVQSGSARRLDRQYRKAAKKLAKLEKRASSGKKYAKRAAKLGVGAAAAGGLAALGTTGVGRIVGGVGTGMQEAGYGASRLAGKYIKNGKVRGAITAAGRAVGGAGTAVKGAQVGINKWGHGTNVGELASKGVDKATGYAKSVTDRIGRGSGTVSKYGTALSDAAKGHSNNFYARAAAAGIGAGLAAGAGYNAYRAATTKRAAKKAAQFRSEMNKAFAGTKYANGAPRQGKKRRK